MMAEALRLGRLRKGRTGGNPAVGAVVARGDEIVGRGFHERAGAPHAEVEALRKAGPRARGATLYVTLEPCAFEGRTSACAPVIIAAALKRVVVGTLDPHPRVAGKGAAMLRRAGVEIVLGVRERECRYLAGDFAKFVAAKTPWVTAKFAASLDGKIATRNGEAARITGPRARRDAHRLRWQHAAVAVGAGTLKADDPRLTVRLRGRDASAGPARVIISSRADVPARARILEEARTPPVWVACTRRADAGNIARLTRGGAGIIMCEEDNGGVSLPGLLRELGARELTSLLVEGGEKLLGAFFGAKLVDRVVAYIAPMIIGGREAPSAVGGKGCFEEGATLLDLKRRYLGPDTRYEGCLTDVDDYFAAVKRATAKLKGERAAG